MKPLILLIGGGGHCKAVIDVIENECRFTIEGIIDKRELIGQKVLNYEIIGCDDDLEKFTTIKNAFISVGQIRSVEPRIRLYNKIKMLGFEIPIIVSNQCYVSKHSQIGEGSIIMHHALVNAGATIGKNCIINTKALIEHDAVVENHCHVSTGAIVNGGVTVREKTFIGSNSTSRGYCEANGFIKAGSVIR